MLKVAVQVENIKNACYVDKYFMHIHQSSQTRIKS